MRRGYQKKEFNVLNKKLIFHHFLLSQSTINHFQL